MDPCAFNAMMEQYEKLVYTVCLRLVHDEHLAQDLAQETFLSAWVHRGDCPAGAQKAWLCRIAANKAKDHLKRAAPCLARGAGTDMRPARAIPHRKRAVFSAGLPGGGHCPHAGPHAQNRAHPALPRQAEAARAAGRMLT